MFLGYLDGWGVTLCLGKEANRLLWVLQRGGWQVCADSWICMPTLPHAHVHIYLILHMESPRQVVGSCSAPTHLYDFCGFLQLTVEAEDTNKTVIILCPLVTEHGLLPCPPALQIFRPPLADAPVSPHVHMLPPPLEVVHVCTW